MYTEMQEVKIDWAAYRQWYEQNVPNGALIFNDTSPTYFLREDSDGSIRIRQQKSPFRLVEANMPSEFVQPA